MLRFQGDAWQIERAIGDALYGMRSGEYTAPETLKSIMDLAISGFRAIAEMVLFLGIAAVGWQWLVSTALPRSPQVAERKSLGFAWRSEP